MNGLENQTATEFNSLRRHRLNSIEQFHYFDSQPQFPNLIAARLSFDSDINESRAREAWQIIGQRQPLFNSTVVPRNGRLIWEKQPDSESDKSSNKSNNVIFEELETAPQSWPIFNRFSRFDCLGPFLLVRRWPTSGQNKHTEAWFISHHAVCDGAAAVAGINEWLMVYENLSNGVDPCQNLPRLSLHRFQQRNCLGLNRWKFLKNLPFQAIGMYGAAKFLFRRHAVLKAQSFQANGFDSSASERPDFPAIIGDWLPPETCRRLESASQQFAVSLNTCLLGVLFGTLERWHDSIGLPTKRAAWLRIILPMNLRELAHRRLPAANRTSLVQIDRRGVPEIGSPSSAAFLKSLQREISIIQRWQLDRMFLIAIRGLSVFPGLLRRVAQNQKPRGIAVFTNLGQPLRWHEKRLARNQETTALIPTEIDFCGPLRPGTSLNFSLARYQNRLRISLHFEPSVVSRAQAAELLKEYLNALERFPE